MDLLVYSRRRRCVEERLTIKENGQFLWFLLIIDSIFRMKDEIEGEGKKDLFEALREYATNNNNTRQLDEINRLEREYDPTRAVAYYSRHAYCYQPLNAALRQMDLDCMFKYRTLICDIHTFLKSESEMRRKNESCRVYNLYRGQAISIEQLQQLQTMQVCANEFFAFKNFASTSTDREFSIAMALASANDDTNLIPVLFHIVINTAKTKHPFADIAGSSHFSSEAETIIDIGAVLHVNEIIAATPEIPYARVKSTLMADEDYEFHDLLSHLKKTKISDKPLNQLIEFADLLESMGEFGKSEQIYRHLLIKYKGDKRAESACHSGLAIIAQRMGHYDQSMKHEQQCVQHQLEILQPDQSNIIELAKAYNNLGLQYGSNQQLEIALQHFRMSNELKHVVFGSADHPLMADTYANIGSCYFEMQEFDHAEQNILRSIKIRQKYENHTNHPDFIQAFMALGNIYGEKGHYDNAIKQHVLALGIARNILPYNHPLLGMCHLNLAGDYKNKNDYTLAKKNYMEAYSIYKHTMDENHPEMQRLLAHLEEVDRH